METTKKTHLQSDWSPGTLVECSKAIITLAYTSGLVFFMLFSRLQSFYYSEEYIL